VRLRNADGVMEGSCIVGMRVTNITARVIISP